MQDEIEDFVAAQAEITSQVAAERFQGELVQMNRYALQKALDRALNGQGNVLLLVKIPNLNYYNKMEFTI